MQAAILAHGVTQSQSFIGGNKSADLLIASGDLHSSDILKIDHALPVRLSELGQGFDDHVVFANFSDEAGDGVAFDVVHAGDDSLLGRPCKLAVQIVSMMEVPW